MPDAPDHEAGIEAAKDGYMASMANETGEALDLTDVVWAEISTAHAPAPRYCPWCGAEIAKWGHDDSCDRPKGVELVWKEWE